MTSPDLPALVLLGIVSGATLCNLGCLAHLGPVLMGTASGFREGFRATLYYIAGKFLVYVLWGGVAGWAGTVLTLNRDEVRSTGFLLVALAILLPLFNHGKCPGKLAAIGKGSSLFSLGAITSFTPCPSLLGILAVAARSGSAAAGLACGAAFGLGLVCSPLILTGGVVGLIADRLRLEVAGLHRIFQGCALFILLILGMRLLIEV
jgi:sulfite exporter TauE/SafE